MTAPRLVFVHGAAMTSAMWTPVIAFLDSMRSFEMLAVQRPRTGSLAAEVTWLADRVEGAFVVGVSGGATLGLALAASDVGLAGALLHEPAVGSLAPGLLDAVAAAYATGGLAAFGAQLYGPDWSPDMAGDTGQTLDAELAMFRSFEPGPPSDGQGPVTVSVGARSPRIRHESVQALADRFGYHTARVEDADHFVTMQAPRAFARLIASLVCPP